jgi:hypothetical protein
MADLSYIMGQVELFGGKMELAEQERSLYPFFFSIDEEIRIVTKLLAGQKMGAAVVN